VLAGVAAAACFKLRWRVYFADCLRDSARTRSAAFRDPVLLRRMPQRAPFYWSDSRQLARLVPDFPIRALVTRPAAGDHRSRT